MDVHVYLTAGVGGINTGHRHTHGAAAGRLAVKPQCSTCRMQRRGEAGGREGPPGWPAVERADRSPPFKGLKPPLGLAGMKDPPQ